MLDFEAKAKFLTHIHDFPILTPRSDLEQSLLRYEQGVEAIKTKGLKVIRAVVTNKSRLLNKTAAEASFRNRYQAAIVAVQKGGKNVPSSLTGVKFDAGDVLVLQASDESPLLTSPPPNFYKSVVDEAGKTSTARKIVSRLSKTFSRNSLLSEAEAAEDTKIERNTNARVEGSGGFYIPSDSDSASADIEAGDGEVCNIQMYCKYLCRLRGILFPVHSFTTCFKH